MQPEYLGVEKTELEGRQVSEGSSFTVGGVKGKYSDSSEQDTAGE